MAKERLVAPETRPTDDAPVSRTMRPRTLADFVGQRELCDKLSIALDAVRSRGESMEHVLLHGPPGLGKTTLANVIAEEMGTKAYVTSGPALTKGTDLVGTLTKMQAGDVLFIDEIHRLPIAVEEYIYSAMEDFRIDFQIDQGLHAKTLTYALKPFTLIGATTRAGMLTGALRSRFGIVHHLRFYDVDDLVRILEAAIARYDMPPVPSAVLQSIARRSRGTPRITLRLLRRVRDFADVRGDGTIDDACVRGALQLEGIDDHGLDALDRAYLETIATVYRGGPVGVDAIAATLGDDRGTLEDVVEPYLLQAGFVMRTQRGRQLTADGTAHLTSP